MKKLILLAIPVFLILIFPAHATQLSSCAFTTGSGYYELQSDIRATQGNGFTSTDCIDIVDNNVILNLNGHSITNANNTLSIGIAVGSNLHNVTIENGNIGGWTSFNDSASIVVNRGDNILVKNIVMSNSTLCAELTNTSVSFIVDVCDSPISEVGIFGNLLNNSQFVINSNSKFFPVYFVNVSNSYVRGNLQSNSIIVQNSTQSPSYFAFIWNTLANIGFLLNPSGVNVNVVDANVLTNAISQPKGFGFVAFNSTNVTYDNMNTIGVVAGFVVDGYSVNNTLSRLTIDKGFASTVDLYLGKNATNNNLCEITGKIFDDCGGTSATFPNECASKHNVMFADCASLTAFVNGTNNSYYPQTASIQNIFLTPLIPNLQVANYPVVTFLFTPFVLITLMICGIGVYLANWSHNNQFGMFFVFGSVTFLGIALLFSIWFSFIFVIVGGYIFLRYRSGEKNEG
jgi:hypothetical protein